MEELLNKLIEKGWKPFGVKGISEFFFESVPVGMFRLCWKKPDYDYNVYDKRDIVSKESGLWQFVCENKLLVKGILDLPDVLWKRDSLACMRTDLRKSCYPHDYEYRIIESALKDESELEDFLLSNIVIKDEE